MRGLENDPGKYILAFDFIFQKVHSKMFRHNPKYQLKPANRFKQWKTKQFKLLTSNIL